MAHDPDSRSTTPPAPHEAGVDAKAAGGAPEGIGQGPGYSGEEYDANAHAAERSLEQGADRRAPESASPDLPPDNGRRAWIDERTGEVHGSGVGAGGGQAGEDFDDDPATGDGPPG